MTEKEKRDQWLADKKKRWGKLMRLVFGRTAFVTLFLIIQLVILFCVFKWLSDLMIYAYGGFTLLSAAVVIYILNRRQNPVYQLSWVIPVLVFPVFGAMFYIFLQLQVGTRRIAARLQDLIAETGGSLAQDPDTLDALLHENRREAMIVRYMNSCGGFPAWRDTGVEYFPLGDVMYPRLLEELKKARHYIFMEYFIIGRGKMWDGILEILEEKAKSGVEVRVMYDGMCSLSLLPYHYPEQLKARGIRAKMFSPVRPAISTYQNNRDHRKITVIDGHTAFTGGVNLADEYINEEMRFGHWKDTAVMIKGKAVKNFLVMFLQMWNITEHREDDYETYLNACLRTTGNRMWLEAERRANRNLCTGGYVMPFGDSPLDEENVALSIYLNILNGASDYVYIMTPYLILDSDLMTALTFAAKRGVDVRIVMPHIPDKKYAFALAHSYYPELLDAGVKIFEYTPGFVHAKMFVSDDERAVVGSVNLDYRSLYLHFECAVYLYRNAAIRRIKADFADTLARCQPIGREDCQRFPLPARVAGRVMRLIAPLM